MNRSFRFYLPLPTLLALSLILPVHVYALRPQPNAAGLEDRLRPAGMEQEITLDRIRQARSWADLFGNDRPVAWEIGFLPGWALEARAIYRLNWSFLGIDLLSSTQVGEWDPSTHPENVRWIFADVRQVEEASRHLGPLWAIFIDFPPVAQETYLFDPPDFFPQLLRRLEPGGEFSLRTESLQVLERFEQAIRLSGDPRPFERPDPSSELEWPMTPFALKLSQSPSPAWVYSIRYRSPSPGLLSSSSGPSKAGVEEPTDFDKKVKGPLEEPEPAAEGKEGLTAQPDEVKKLRSQREEATVEFRLDRPVDFQMRPPLSLPISGSSEDRFWIWSEPLQIEPADTERLRVVFSRIRILSNALDQGEPLHAVFWASGPPLEDPSEGNFLGLLVGRHLVASPTARFYLLPDPEVLPLIRLQLGWEPHLAIPVVRRGQAAMERRNATSLTLRLSRTTSTGLEEAALRLRVQQQLYRITHEQALHWQIAGPSVVAEYKSLTILAHYLRHFEIDPGGKEAGEVVEELAAQRERVGGVTYYGTPEEHENFRRFASPKGIFAGEKPVSPKSGDFQSFLQQLLSNLLELLEESFPAWVRDRGADLTQLTGDLESLAGMEELRRAT